MFKIRTSLPKKCRGMQTVHYYGTIEEQTKQQTSEQALG
jgi:hypothetical protein